MKLYHLADIHLGKIIYGRSMLDDQRDWIEKFLALCREGRPDAVLIAGDVYDRSAPSAEAVVLLDRMLTALSEMDIPALMVAGNHDSGRRLSFGHAMLAKQKVHIAGTAKAEVETVTFPDPDGFGPVTFYLIPYLFPEEISNLFEEESLRSYDAAMRKLLEAQDVDPACRNVVISHQNITANGAEAERGGSESMVGGIGQIDYSVFDRFDYAALGHIHSAYHVGRPAVRYAGTPLCYHLAESRQAEKGPIEVILGPKGTEPQIRTIPIEPLHKMRALTGTRKEIYDLLEKDPGRDEYIGITITDERITPESNAYLRGLLESRGSVLMELISTFYSFSGGAGAAEAVETKSLTALFTEFYRAQYGGIEPSDEEYALIKYTEELAQRKDPHASLDPKDVLKLLDFAKTAGGDGR
ncbi:MAG: exonuclease SbcCD subunit D [Lachnospiraceae bacterium]|nr:exonuclease SbcCD subunit D [Lachnospiraceae bacterium]